jgi:hypothetical protein
MPYQYLPNSQATVAYPTALLTLLPCPNDLSISKSFSYSYSCSTYGVSYSAASPEFLNNDQTPPLPAIAALLTAPSYYAASAELLNSDQTPPLTAIAALLTALLTLLLALNALPILNSLSYSYCYSF